jgi:NADPH:quinone reductase-like Zn-dependent oxidoreductase
MKKMIVALLLVLPLAAWAAPAVPYLPVPKGAAVILNTGSTNTLGYRIVVQRSGAAEYVNGPRRAKGSVPASIAARFFADLQAAMPLSARGSSNCMKSASFGSSLFVWWKGSRSGDLTCGAAGAIGTDALQIAQALGASTVLRTRLIRPIPMLTNEPRKPLPQPLPTPTP